MRLYAQAGRIRREPAQRWGQGSAAITEVRAVPCRSTSVRGECSPPSNDRPRIGLERESRFGLREDRDSASALSDCVSAGRRRLQETEQRALRLRLFPAFPIDSAATRGGPCRGGWRSRLSSRRGTARPPETKQV